ncbi:PKD domain-containing protein [Cellulomonas marina]|uniref:PKD repeat-containing protein n=1 Tax=Cellulomonas marina TaxID=988821 RepID=A0A1I0X6C0_9CELL|nr:PKD domain-containing protein [Cellulomonas marina]GIG28925.1 PDK repeat-containing protein [Cellulomonas marina]SFA95583.1 PKD repeat-containing protein [Cellulomonas marina]
MSSSLVGSAPARLGAALLALVLAAVGLVALDVPAARAAVPTAVPASAGDTVSADALPTVQTNGIVWAQVVVGNTVYVTGDFTSARPAGSPAGTNEVPRTRLLAYDIRTGELVPGWAPSINAVGRAIAASPDGRTIYVGGDFTQAGTTNRTRLAAFNATTGALVNTWAPAPNAPVRSITTTASTVYFGGNFTSVGGTSRPRVAATNASDGRLTSFYVSAQSAQVESVRLTPDGTKLVIAGRFSKLNEVANPGVGWVDATTGKVLPFPANKRVVNYGYSAAIYSLTVTGRYIIGSGFGFLSANDGSVANLEGLFAADVTTGELVWVEDCKGDTYSSFASPDGNVYLAGHPHNCANANAFYETSQRSWKYGLSFSQDAAFLTKKTSTADPDWGGTPAPAIRNWFPTFTSGTWSGQSQAGWSVTGNADYVVYGGEFPSVNGTGQAGLVRFARKTIAPNARGPQLSGITPSVVSRARGSVSLSWPAAWDQDDKTLTYRVIRDNVVVGTVEHSAFYWDRGRVSYVDTGLADGRTYGYKVQVVDSGGSTFTSGVVNATTVSSQTAALSPYSAEVLGDNPSSYWRLGDAGATQNSWTGNYNPATQSGATSTDGAVVGSTDGALRFAGTSSSIARSTQAETATDTVSVEAWFRTSTTSGGKIVGFGRNASTPSTSYDRMIWMGDDGRVSWGVFPQETKVLTSPGALNDDRWHHVVGTLGQDGQHLYVDGVLVGSDTGTVTAQVPTGGFVGYWRIGGDTLAAPWAPLPSSAYFAGAIDEVATYNKQLTALEVARHQSFGTTGKAPVLPPTASFTASTSKLTVSTDGTASTDRDGSVADWTWSWGDGTTSSGATATHTYAEPGTYGVTLTVTDDGGAVGTSQQDVTVALVAPTAVMTTTTNKLTVTADGSGSTDTDGTVTGWRWAWGDGATGEGATATHTYAAPGTYTVVLTATDSDGQTATTSAGVTVGLAAPVASFTSSVSGLTVALDGSGSTDADGTVRDHAWTFGDGATGTGRTISHTFAKPGTYDVTLTVTDDDGVTGTRTAQVEIGAPVTTVVGADTFGRTVTSGLGTADTGGAWTTTSGVASVSGGAGRLALATKSSAASGRLPGASGTDLVTSATFALDKRANGSGTYLMVRGRIADNGDAYRLKITVGSAGTVTAQLAKGVGSTETALGSAVTVPGTLGAGAGLRATLSVTGSGPSSVQGKVWLAAQAEPTGWTVQATDSTPSLQGSGHAGVYAALSSSTTNGPVVVALDDVQVTNTAAVAAVAPVAAFTASTAKLTASVDGSSSTDSDGTVRSWAWTWGDGATSTGTTASHTYRSAGTYPVTLTVTDDWGLTSTTTRQVTVALAPPEAVLTTTTDRLAVTADGTGSSDPDGSIASYAWSWGDGSTGTGATATHTYASAGTYDVTLTVTDDDGMTASATRSVAVTAVPTVAVLGADAFERSVASGFGTAETGGAWVTTANVTSVAGGAGRLSLATKSSAAGARLPGAAGTDLVTTASFTVDKRANGSGSYFLVRGRIAANDDAYRLKLNVSSGGTVTAFLVRSVSGVETAVSSTATVPGTLAAGQKLWATMAVTGTSPTTLQARIWLDGQTQPTGWTLTATDNQATLQTSGHIGFYAQLSSSTTNGPVVVALDDVRVTDRTE